MKKKVHLSLLIHFLLIFSLNAQTDNVFFTNMELYPKQITDLIGTNATKEEEMQLIDFTIAWRSSLFSDSDKDVVLQVSNAIFNHKGREIHFKLLSNMLFLLKKSTNPEMNYPIVMSYLKELINNKKNSLAAVSSFMLNIINVLNDNYLHNSTTVKWQYSNSDYEFRIQNHIFSIAYSNGSLKCYSKNDSLEINQTSGIYFPTEQKWISYDGMVTWERAGFKAPDVHVKLGHYQIDLYKVEYSADSVIFTYGKYFSKPVMGKLNDKVMNIENPESTVYPEF